MYFFNNKLFVVTDIDKYLSVKWSLLLYDINVPLWVQNLGLNIINEICENKFPQKLFNNYHFQT